MSLFSLRWLSLLVCFLSLTPLTCNAVTNYVEYTDLDGQVNYLADNRQPALYTQNFGDCLGSSLINVTRFDAAYYQDNMTVLFHLEGNTNVANESVMLYIGVFAYGENRFNLTFNPCFAQIESLCPMNRSVSIEADGIIPVDQSDVAGIPSIALSIPDFEGQAILRLFGNSTESEIGCYSAVVTNGVTMSHPSSVSTVLGLFTLVAVVSSVATAVYGDRIPTIRPHYAHSLSIFVLFAIFHHIYYTGALSMNWPSILAAFWSNFAWSAGMIYSQPMQDSINQFIGSNKGNTSMISATSNGSSVRDLAGTFEISQIYKRLRSVENHIIPRTLTNSSDGFDWYGSPIKPGLPLPGNFSGFSGVLSQEGIPASNAFMTGFLWFLILAVIIAASIVAFKWILEGLSKRKLLKTNRLDYFRAHWVRFTIQAVLRMAFIGFFMMMFLTLFEFASKASAGPTAIAAIAAIVFIIFFFGMFGVAGYAAFYRLRHGHYEFRPNRLHFEKTKAFGCLPWLGFGLDSNRLEKLGTPRTSMGSVALRTLHYINDNPDTIEVHEDEDYIQKFGWLAARFRRTKWWFFTIWLVYEFVRACFYGGAADEPLTQVFGLLVVEVIALVFVIIIKPFEAARLNALLVYCLGFSKIATLGLSIAFDARFNLPRIITTVIGVAIIVIQGLLTIVLLVAVVIGAISSYMSLTRNHENFKPEKLAGFRQRYFDRLEKVAPDVPPPPPPPPEEPKAPYFFVSSVRRNPKIGDEENTGSVSGYFGSRSSVQVSGPGTGPATTRASRANSVSRLSQLDGTHGSLPFGARPAHANWYSRDNITAEHSNRHSRNLSSASGLGPSRPPSYSYGVQTKSSDSSLRETAMRRNRRSSTQSGPLDVRRSWAGTGVQQPVVDERNIEDQETSVELDKGKQAVRNELNGEEPEQSSGTTNSEAKDTYRNSAGTQSETTTEHRPLGLRHISWSDFESTMEMMR